MSTALDILAEMAESFDLQLQEDYTGRNMYGKTCVGVVGDFANLWEFALEVGSRSFEWLDHAPSQDSMGYDSIYYWPRVQAEELRQHEVV